MNLEFILTTSQIIILASVSLLLATLGAIISEKSGVTNLSIDGTMLVGALTAFVITKVTGSPYIGVLVAMIASGLLSLIHATLTTYFLSNQIVTGLALNFFAMGLANFFGKNYVGEVSEKLPVLFANFDILVFISFFLAIFTYFIFNNTKIGLNLVAVGEDPRVADNQGVNPFKYRFWAQIIGGMIVGLGGAHLSLSYTPGWVDGMTSGRGWIAIALVIFSFWNPMRAILGTLLFGGISFLQFHFQTIGTNIPAAFFNMLPYLMTILVMIFFSGVKSGSLMGAKINIGPSSDIGPSSLGRHYIREDR
ncbi:MAG: ABC transporter permease [Oligoflexia bacterium]|nr:ABC transporter permease [Oligoflexia bacterium]